MNKFLSLLGFDPAKHSVRVEMMAGLTTFLTMSYILAVNPIILSDAGMDKGAVFSATVIAAAIATLVMAFYAKMPFALASGMGINAFFAYTLVIVLGYSWQQALAAVFVEGIVFILLTFFKVREAIVNAIPLNLRYSISVGIGLFIAFIGLKNGGLVVANEATMTSLGTWNPTTIVAAGGILLGAILMALKVKGGLFYTIIIMTIVGIPLGVTQIPEGFTLLSMPHSLEPVALHIDFSRFISLDIEYYIVVATLLFMDLFDTIGTLIGAATGAGMADKQTGRIHNLSKALMADWREYAAERGMSLQAAGEGHRFTVVAADGEETVVVASPEGAIPCETVQKFLDDFLSRHPEAEIDFIHGEDSLRTLAGKPGTVGLLLPEIDKHSFFADVERLGVLPRKTFSMGEADEKRFYMEAKRI